MICFVSDCSVTLPSALRLVRFALFGVLALLFLAALFCSPHKPFGILILAGTKVLRPCLLRAGISAKQVRVSYIAVLARLQPLESSLSWFVSVELQ